MRQEPLGFKSKTLIVNNLLELKGQEAGFKQLRCPSFQLDAVGEDQATGSAGRGRTRGFAKGDRHGPSQQTAK